MSKQNQNILTKPETFAKTAVVLALGALAIAEGPRAFNSGAPERPAVVLVHNVDGHYQGTGHAEWGNASSDSKHKK